LSEQKKCGMDGCEKTLKPWGARLFCGGLKASYGQASRSRLEGLVITNEEESKKEDKSPYPSSLALHPPIDCGKLVKRKPTLDELDKRRAL
jgi:hypothetical protein